MIGLWKTSLTLATKTHAGCALTRKKHLVRGPLGLSSVPCPHRLTIVELRNITQVRHSPAVPRQSLSLQTLPETVLGAVRSTVLRTCHPRRLPEIPEANSAKSH